MNQFRFDRITNFNVGEQYVESDQLGNVYFEVITAPVVTGQGNTRQVTFKARDIISGREINYLISEQYQHYGPKIYNEAVYLSRADVEALTSGATKLPSDPRR